MTSSREGKTQTAKNNKQETEKTQTNKQMICASSAIRRVRRIGYDAVAGESCLYSANFSMSVLVPKRFRRPL
jgi:hypothetical protein